MKRGALLVAALSLAALLLGCGDDAAPPRADGGIDHDGPFDAGVVDTCAGCTGDDAYDHDAPTCPAEIPNDEPCGALPRCDYGVETCCGESYPSTICQCQSGTWACYASDACLIPSCPDAG